MRRLIFCVAMVVVLAAAGQLPAASFQGLGFLPGGDFSRAKDVSDDGSVVVGYTGFPASISRESFRWTPETGMVPVEEMQVYAVSGDGRVLVGGVEGIYEENAARWTQAEGIVVLDDGPEPPGDSCARGVNTDGSVIVGRGFRWTTGSGMVHGETVQNVSADGSVMVGRLGRWTAETGWVSIGTLRDDDEWIRAYAVSADGSVVAGSGYPSQRAFRWTAETRMVDVGTLPGDSNANIRDVSADGSLMVGDSSHGVGTARAFLWDDTHGMRNLKQVLTDDFGLDLTEWELYTADGMSADGTIIVGLGRGPSGQTEAWRAVIPEPSSLVLLGTAVVVLVAWAWGRRRRA